MKKILICDDDSGVLRVLSRALGAAGYATAALTDGDALLSALERETPDLVLLDIHMPNVDGIETLRRIHRARPQLGVIVMSGDGSPARAKLALDAGACDFLSKPFDLQYVKTAVLAHLGARTGGV
jgi:DNA-binding NtrC family response regulator